ncbi:hypothetical protein EV702DRAFT_1181467 [Suillus placidus]|uniref:CxC1-like cysteine cluster associated with KDZ transposases domain-containing protein n=1 Tax=Suillus placidus TaxID=48579 RepID=A0A9P7CYS8_9AGAM|nr:hypothetical protein EV702DRAFT_1181467 [Suillus placidus]
MHAAWNAQTQALVDAYLHWKHGPRNNINAESRQPVHHFHISKVDVFDYHPVCEIAQNHEEMANIALLRVGLLGCSPTTPTVAITLQCLELYHQLRRRQSSFSIQPFTKVLCALHNVTYIKSFREQLLIAFDVYLAIIREVQSRIYVVLGRSDPDWWLPNSCPACTFKQPDEVYDRVSDVDRFKDNVRLHPGERSAGNQPDLPLTCTDNWQAANSASGSKNTVHVFEQTGIFLSACRHGIIQTLTEMRRSGELAKYPLVTINKLLDVFGDHLGIGTDIGCSLRKTVAASSIREKAAIHHLILAVNAFHGHAHNCKCQLQHHPLYLCGFGLEDLETCEHVFAASNAAAPLIHDASHCHYIQFLELHFNQWDIDKYLELSRFILNNYKQALTIISNYTKELEAYRAMFPGEELDFESWIAEEFTYLEAMAVEPTQDTTAVEYVEALEKLEKCQAAFEALHNNQFASYTPSSFMPDSGLSQDALHATKQGHAARRAAERRLQVQISVVEDIEDQMSHQFICAVEDLEGLIVQRMFELSKANLASTAIVKCSGAIQSALDTYNKLAVSQNPRRPTLQYSEVMSYAALGEFEILKCSCHDILAKPWSNGIHCKMTNKYFKIIRAQEEITRLNAWVDMEDSDIEQMATELDLTDTRLAAELWLLYNRQHRINNVHRNCLARIYRLPGYTGSIPLQVNTVVTSSKNEEEYDPMLEGEVSAQFESCIQHISQ